MPRELMDRIRTLFAELIVERAEEQVRAKWKSFGIFWQRSPSVVVGSNPTPKSSRQPKVTA
jgi:hypothetical protein